MVSKQFWTNKMNNFWKNKFGNYLSLILLATFLSIYIFDLKIIDLGLFLLFGFALAAVDLIKK